MPDGQALVDRLSTVISTTGGSQPAFDVDVPALRDLLARETLAMAQTGVPSRSDRGELALGGATLKVRIALTADGSERRAELVPEAGEEIHVAIAQGGNGRQDPIGGRPTPGSDAAVRGDGLGDALLVALGGQGVDERVVTGPPGTTGGDGGAGAAATGTVPGGSRGRAGSGGSLVGAVPSGSVRSRRKFAPGTKGAGSGGSDGSDDVR